jgi:hypothetical protein
MYIFAVLLRFAVAALTVLMPGTAAAIAADTAVVISKDGTIELAISRNQYTCPRPNKPDMPVHAYRQSNNQLRIFATNSSNYPFISPSFNLSDLNSMQQICTPMLPAYSPMATPDPQTFFQKQWITATYTRDGTTVYGFVHNEFHGKHYDSLDPPCTKKGAECWYASLTKVISANSGNTFSPASPPPGNFIAGSLYRFSKYQPDGKVTTRVGTAGPSNVVWNPKDQFYYMFMRRLEDYGPQQNGECVVRSRDLNEWFFWDGSGFTKSFENPYTTTKTPEARVCQTLDNHFGRIRSVVYSSVYDTFITVVPSSGGIGYATSSDLVQWSPLANISGVTGVLTAPSLIDASSTARNFDTTRNSPYLYWTDDVQRQVYRVKLKITAK